MTTRERESGVDAGARTGAGGGRLRATFDFYCFEQLTALRLRFTLRQFQLVLAGGFLVGMVVLLSVSLVVLTLVRAVAGEREGAGYAVAALFCAGNVYAAAGYLFREAVSGRRFAVSNSPNVGFFRALDISARDVLFIYCGLRTTAYYSALLLVDVCFVALFRSTVGGSLAGVLAVLVVPLALYVVTMAVAAKAAGRRSRPEPLKRGTLLLLGALCLGLGYGTARFLIGPIRESGFAGSFTQEQVSALLAATGLAAAVVGVVFGVRLVREVRRVVRDSFAIQEVRPLPAVRPLGRLGGDMVGILHREMVSSWAYPLVRKSFAVLAMMLLCCLGAIGSGAGVLPMTDLPGRLFTVLSAVLFTVFLGTTELILRLIGPTTFAAQFRYAWENHLSQWRIAVSATLYYALPVVALAIGTIALVWMLTGSLSPDPLSIGVAVVAAALIAETVTVAPRNVDGSTAANTVGGLVALVLGAPVLLVLTFDSAAGAALAAGYAVCLLGGAVTCLGRRVRTLPSTSAM